MNRVHAFSILAAGTAAAVSLGVYAADRVAADNDAKAIASAIPIGQAVVTAEQHVGGKATRAELERDKKGRGVFDVEVSTPDKVFDVQVDASTGVVLASSEDKADQEDEHDDAD
jgi:uncharacterized membrane protein YkoI